MQILKEHIIPELIKIQLVSYTMPSGSFATPHYEIHWRFWRPEIRGVRMEGPSLGWAGANWSHATAHEIEAQQWFDIAVARVSAWIINGQDIPIDIMHDHETI